tara:strand:+ start:107 stop:226 length:120 start_codon:yes stop_codon:yes gene_type:complete
MKVGRAEFNIVESAAKAKESNFTPVTSCRRESKNEKKSI